MFLRRGLSARPLNWLTAKAWVVALSGFSMNPWQAKPVRSDFQVETDQRTGRRSTPATTTTPRAQDRAQTVEPLLLPFRARWLLAVLHVEQV